MSILKNIEELGGMTSGEFNAALGAMTAARCLSLARELEFELSLVPPGHRPCPGVAFQADGAEWSVFVGRALDGAPECKVIKHSREEDGEFSWGSGASGADPEVTAGALRMLIRNHKRLVDILRCGVCQVIGNTEG